MTLGVWCVAVRKPGLDWILLNDNGKPMTYETRQGARDAAEEWRRLFPGISYRAVALTCEVES